MEEVCKGLVLIAVEFRESVIMGETSLSPQEVRQIVVAMGKSFKGNSYHLLQMNCNHFASDLCKQLVGKRAPSWVGKLLVRKCTRRAAMTHRMRCYCQPHYS